MRSMRGLQMTPVDPTVVPDETMRRRVYRVRNGQACDLPVVEYLRQGCVLTEWTLTEEERQALIRGEAIRLWVWNKGQTIPVLQMEVTSETGL